MMYVKDHWLSFIAMLVAIMALVVRIVTCSHHF